MFFKIIDRENTLCPTDVIFNALENLTVFLKIGLFVVEYLTQKP